MRERAPLRGLQVFAILFVLDVHTTLFVTPLSVISVLVNIVLMPALLPLYVFVLTRDDQTNAFWSAIDRIGEDSVPGYIWRWCNVVDHKPSE